MGGGVEYNYRRGRHAMDATPVPEPVAHFAATCGTDAPTYSRERPGMSAFVLEDGVVYHTYSTYARGLDGLWGMYQWLDRRPQAQGAQQDGRLVATPRRVRQALEPSRGCRCADRGTRDLTTEFSGGILGIFGEYSRSLDALPRLTDDNSNVPRAKQIRSKRVRFAKHGKKSNPSGAKAT